jgi:hypothetical protein
MMALHAWAEQATVRLKEALSCVPFYAKRAAAEQAEFGDEMNCWRHLQSSEATLQRRPKASSTAVGT